MVFGELSYSRAKFVKLLTRVVENSEEGWNQQVDPNSGEDVCPSQKATAMHTGRRLHSHFLIHKQSKQRPLPVAVIHRAVMYILK